MIGMLLYDHDEYDLAHQSQEKNTNVNIYYKI
jgi:hypothetical protein